MIGFTQSRTTKSFTGFDLGNTEQEEGSLKNAFSWPFGAFKTMAASVNVM